MENLNYTKKNGNICFREDDHVYFDITNPDRKFISVTTLIEKFAQPFDKDFWSAYKALEKLLDKDAWAVEKKSLLSTKQFNPSILEAHDISTDAFNKEQQRILDEWDAENRKSCERGTKIHAGFEQAFYKQKTDISLKRFELGGKFECRKDYTDLNLEHAVYPEYLIHRISKDGRFCLAGQIDLLVKNGNHFSIVDHKGLPLDTPILTSNGWSTMGDLKVGDKVFDKDGNLCTVTVKSAVHHNPCCKINFDNSESIIADIDHRWYVSFKLQKPTKKNPDGYKHVIMTTIELQTYLESIEKRTTHNIPRILNAKPLNLEEKKLPLDPYLLGVWLGDGSKSCGIITQATGSPVWEELRSRGYTFSENLNHNPERAGVDVRTVYGIRGILDYLGVLNNKHIPEMYILASYEQRLDLLRGLMDTDGYFHPKRKRFVMNTSQEWQVRDLRKLLGTLGIKSTIFDAVNTFNVKKFPGWNLCFTTDKFNPFLTRNQDIKDVVQHDSFRNIVSIEDVETVPTQCIAVDSPSHTYLCTESLIVTHNTNKKIDTKSFYNKQTRTTTKMQFPLNNLDDTNYWHYALQLSTYAWMIKQLDPSYVIDDLILNHVDHSNNVTIYHVPFLEKEVIRMLNFYKKQVILDENRKKRQPIVY